MNAVVSNVSLLFGKHAGHTVTEICAYIDDAEAAQGVLTECSCGARFVDVSETIELHMGDLGIGPGGQYPVVSYMREGDWELLKDVCSALWPDLVVDAERKSITF